MEAQGGDPGYDAAAEDWLETAEAMQAAFASRVVTSAGCRRMIGHEVWITGRGGRWLSLVSSW